MVNCGEYSTPNKERIAVYWRGTFLFDYDQKTEALCTTNAGSAVGLGVVPGKTAAIYQLSTGELWFWSFREGDLNYARNYEKFRKPGEDIEHLLALSYDGNLMTVYRNGVLQVRSAMNVPSYNLNPNTALTLKDRVDFEYAAAFSRDGKVLALGSQFGTVVLYGHK